MELFLPEGDGAAQIGIGRERRRATSLASGSSRTPSTYSPARTWRSSRFCGDHDWRHLRSASSPLRIQLLTLPSGAVMPLGDLRMRQAVDKGQHDAAPLLVIEQPEAALQRSRFRRGVDLLR